ncbi:MAG: cysteine desulfurase family protein [Candidatus Saccharimonadales bacterium]
MSIIYLDYAAATPLDPKVFKVMRPYFSNKFFNPTATYLAAKEVRQTLEQARSSVALQLGVRSAEIIFTAGGTEANNLAIHGIMRRFPGKKVITSSIEHASILAAAHQYQCLEAPVDDRGEVDVMALKKLIDPDTTLVSVMYANNEIGTIQPIRQIATVIAQVLVQRRQAGINLPLYFHSDATQAANYLDLHVSHLGIDMMTLNGGKIYGPKQSGILWVRSGVELESILQGGGQERNLRSGTESITGDVGFSLALQIAQKMRFEESARLKHLQQLFFDQISKKIPGAIVNGSLKRRLPNNIHLTFPGVDNERLVIELEEAGILAATGSACSASDEKPSHVLQAMGISDDNSKSSIRLTMGRSTTESNIRQTVEILAQLIA